MRYLIAVAATASLAFTACTADTHTISPSGTKAGAQPAGLVVAQRRIAQAALHHGPEIGHGSTIMVSEGNHHMVFPGNTPVIRNGDGITVTFNGRVMKFSKDASIDTSGVYQRFAAK